jgi:hypothetical protein
MFTTTCLLQDFLFGKRGRGWIPCDHIVTSTLQHIAKYSLTATHSCVQFCTYRGSCPFWAFVPQLYSNPHCGPSHTMCSLEDYEQFSNNRSFSGR